MKNIHKLTLILVLTSATVLIVLALLVYFLCKRSPKTELKDIESTEQKHEDDGCVLQVVDLVTFQDGEDLTISDILEAPGEVIGKSNYGTLYKALLQSSDSVKLLRFLRPACTARIEDFGEVIQLLGCIRHPNLVPLLGFYAGPRGEKLLIHPYYWRGSLAPFVRG